MPATVGDCIVRRWWAKVAVQPDGCWLWIGGTTQGYGRMHVAQGEPMVYAHRLAYEMFVGPIPPGHDVDHQCHNADPTCPGSFECKHRLCVNPAHLEPATRQDNLLRGQTLARAHHLGVDCGFVACRACRRHRLPVGVAAAALAGGSPGMGASPARATTARGAR